MQDQTTTVHLRTVTTHDERGKRSPAPAAKFIRTVACMLIAQTLL